MPSAEHVAWKEKIRNIVTVALLQLIKLGEVSFFLNFIVTVSLLKIIQPVAVFFQIS